MTSKSQPQRVIVGEKKKEIKSVAFFEISPILENLDHRMCMCVRARERETRADRSAGVTVARWIIEHVRGSSVLTDGSVITVIPTSLELLCHV